MVVDVLVHTLHVCVHTSTNCREPTTEDVVAIVHQMYKDDGLSTDDIHTLVTTFRNQSLDFFGAVRASTYDGQIRDWMVDVSGEHCTVLQLLLLVMCTQIGAC